ncbi:Nn.00g040120.m01.CDS01 [Neocucurbitaria sp. VM-36]
MSLENSDRGQGLASQNACVGVATALTAFSIVIVALRVYTRAFIVRNVGRDDAAILVALLLTVAYLITIFVLRDNGLGFSGRVLTPEQMVNQIRTTLAIEIIYYFLINAIKISILFFYLRIAAAKQFEHLCKGTIYFLATFCGMWDLTGMVQGKCINTTALFYSTSSVNIAVDIWILVLPVTTLLKVRRPGREKLALIVIFSLGIFSCIASIVRLHAIRIYTESKDPFFDSVPINLWSMVEVNMGILCASIPALKALFSKTQRERSQNSAYQYHSRERSGGKTPGNGSSGNGSAGTVIQNEVIDLKAMENGGGVPRPDTRRSSNGGGGAWLASDSEFEEQRIIHPEARV